MNTDMKKVSEKHTDGEQSLPNVPEWESRQLSDSTKTTVEKIENSPFSLVTINDKCKIALGNYLLTDETEKEEALNIVVRLKGLWEFIGAFVIANIDYELKVRGVIQHNS